MQNKINSTSFLREFDGLEQKIAITLIKGGILTLNDLLSKSEEDLLMTRNIGKNSVAIIRKWLDEKGLHLFVPTQEFDGLELKVANALVHSGILTLEDLLSKKESELLIIRNISHGNVTLVRKWLNEKGLDLKPEFSSFSVKLSDCKDFYFPTARILMSNGISTLEELLSKTEEDIIQIEGISHRHLSIIKIWVEKYHLSLSSN